MTFSLLDRPWLPLVTTEGQPHQGSLREALLEPDRWAGLDAAHPLQCLALYRLLLAIAHRAIGPGDLDDRIELLDSWPTERIEAYLQQWADRFELFGGDRPFMQHPGLVDAGLAPRPLTVLAPDRSSGNTRTLWDRSLDDSPVPLPPAEQALLLVVHQQFTPGGLVRAIRTSATRAAANGLELVMPLGSSLMETLVLNVLPQSAEEHQLDLPCWERPLVGVAALGGKPERVPAGPADRYTVPVRAVLLQSTTHLLYAPGEIIGESPVADPMSAVVQAKKGPIPLFLREGRALWRDATALLGGAGAVPPVVLQHAADVQMAAGNYEPVELLAGGLLTDQARMVLWRLEQRHLAPALVSNAEAQAVVEALLEQAQSTSSALYGATKSLCRHWLDQGSEAGAAPAAVSALRDSLQADAVFWGSLETEFWGAMHALGTGAAGEAVLEAWRQTLRLTVRTVWDHCCRQIGDDGRALRAQGLAGRALGRVLAGLAPAEVAA